MVQMKIWGHSVDLMVDTGAEHSVVTQQVYNNYWGNRGLNLPPLPSG
jgi:hypothetical protein